MFSIPSEITIVRKGPKLKVEGARHHDDQQADVLQKHIGANRES